MNNFFRSILWSRFFKWIDSRRTDSRSIQSILLEESPIPNLQFSSADRRTPYCYQPNTWYSSADHRRPLSLFTPLSFSSAGRRALTLTPITRLKPEIANINLFEYIDSMPKTRWGCIKNRARRQLLKLKSKPANANDSQYLGVESYYDIEYKKLFESNRMIKSGITRREINSGTDKLIKWPSSLTPLTVEYPSLPFLNIPKSDPWRTRYL